MSQRNHPSMSQNLFSYLPSEIIINILSRLPVRSVISCKCVCKSWLCLLETHEFVKAHLSKAVPGLTCYQRSIVLYEVFEFEDGLDIEQHELHYNSIIEFDLPPDIPYADGWICGSVNGILLLGSGFTTSISLYICNPISREYARLPSPQEFLHPDLDVTTSGIGVSKISGKHKVILIFNDYKMGPERPELECLVYTIGTGSWRRVAPVAPLVYVYHSFATILNGNLHWFVDDVKVSQSLISFFNLETEHFSTISPPFQGISANASVFALRECLCLCVNSSEKEIVVWLMEEYGIENSWRKEFVMCKAPNYGPYGDLFMDEVIIYPIKVFENGDILMDFEHDFLFYYSKEKNTTLSINLFESGINSIPHTSSFLSIKSLGMDNVRLM